MWAWWIGIVVGVAVLAGGIVVFTVVGWATHRAQQLDDPTHPYLPPLHRPHERNDP